MIVQKLALNGSSKANILIHTHTYAKSSSDPSPSPAVMSLADWLSLAVPSPTSFLFLRKRRVFRDLSFDFRRPSED